MTTNNHPANGPVSLARLHQISEILSKAAAQSDGGNLGYAMADAVKVIDGAIAAFGAEPVLYAAEETLAYAKMGELHLKCLSQPMGDAVIPLYTAPPAPVVPDEKPIPNPLKMYAVDAVAAIAEVRGWNACRAAMLQAGNSPVTPDTWIPVSERMPDEIGRYWCYVEEQNSLGKSHYQWNCSWNGERWWIESDNGGRVTHWMPLPAAPKQEVK